MSETNFIESVISKHRKGGILVDSNLLLLLLVGVCDRSLIARCKRLNAYTQGDFDLLLEFCGRFRQIVTTPHLLTEVSNLFEKNEPRILKIFFTFLSQHVFKLDEVSEKSSTLVQHKHFTHFGLADSAVAQACDGGLLILTDDLRLYDALARHGADAVNFNHLRMFLM
jgi:hypothetical protein